MSHEHQPESLIHFIEAGKKSGVTPDVLARLNVHTAFQLGLLPQAEAAQILYHLPTAISPHAISSSAKEDD